MNDPSSELVPLEPYPLESELPDRLVVVGDLNGHARLLDLLLEGTGLIDSNGNWCGGGSCFVQMGDILNRGSTSRSAMERMLALRFEARSSGGEVLYLLGNHEVMTALQHEAYVTAQEYMEFATEDEISAYEDQRTRQVYRYLGAPDRPHRVEPMIGALRAWEEQHAPGKEAFRAAFAEDGYLGQHIRMLPVAFRVGPLLFVHGGLSPQWAELGLLELDRRVRETWAQSPETYQDLDPAGVLRDPLGPLWHRMYCLSDTDAAYEDVVSALRYIGAGHMVVGHTRTESVPGGEAGRPLLRQDGLVLMSDVGIGEPGEPGCAIVVEGGLISSWSPIRGWEKVGPLQACP